MTVRNSHNVFLLYFCTVMSIMDVKYSGGQETSKYKDFSSQGGKERGDLIQKGQTGCWKISGDRLHMPGGLELVSKLLLSQTPKFK